MVMKIFALKINGETEWLAANTIIEALQQRPDDNSKMIAAEMIKRL